MYKQRERKREIRVEIERTHVNKNGHTKERGTHGERKRKKTSSTSERGRYER